MTRTAKRSDVGRKPIRRLSDSEILLFVSRTLQPRLDDAGAPNVFAKLQRLKDALRLQETSLLDVPDCVGKERLRDTLADARSLIAEIVDDLAGASRRDVAVEAKTA
jgi:hypothetical protein